MLLWNLTRNRYPKWRKLQFETEGTWEPRPMDFWYPFHQIVGGWSLLSLEDACISLHFPSRRKKNPMKFLGVAWSWNLFKVPCLFVKKKPRWWFQMFSNFTYTSGSDPIWLIFFRWVETTNQFCVYKTLFFHFLIYLEPSLQSPIYQVTRPLVPIFLGNWKMRDGVIDILPNGLTYTQVN